jgi:hypothetical protein
MASYGELPLGAIHRRGFTDFGRHDRRQPLLVVREVTEADYRACLRHHGCDPDEEPPFSQQAYFYEIMVD